MRTAKELNMNLYLYFKDYPNYMDIFNKNITIDEYNKISLYPKDQDWHIISLYKDLSKEFIAEFFNYLSFEHIMMNDNISNDIKDYCRMFM